MFQRMVCDGRRVYIITASHYKTVKAKIEWLRFYYSFIPTENIILAWHKQMILGDVLIDDAVYNLESGAYHKVLVTKPHSRSYDAESHDMIRVETWSEIYCVITQLVAQQKIQNSKETKP